MREDTYDEVVAEVAKDLALEEPDLRRAFSAWLARTGSSTQPAPDLAHACYAVYRLTKLKTALRMVHRSRDGWKERAILLGSPRHLRDA
jgi:hypothetical protein